MRTLFRARRVRTLATPATGEWIVTDDRHVQRVGTGDPPEADRVVELPGATLMPGFIDAHVHLTSTGIALANADVEAARSKDDLLALARARTSTDDDQVVLLQGFDESLWERPDLPSASELDSLTPRPLVIRRIDGHAALVNSAALTAARALEAEGLERDEHGEPRGLVTREANRRVLRWVAESRRPLLIEELQLAAGAQAASRGITCVHEMAMPLENGSRDVEVLLAHRERLPVDVVPIVATTDVARALDLGVGSIGGDLAIDGSIGARTAALTAAYADRDDAGSMTFTDDDVASFFHDGHDAGLQVGVHAIGDLAIEQVLRTWERVYGSLDSRERRHFRARRHRIEHFEMATPHQIERAAVLGLAVSVQPVFDDRWGMPGGLYATALGQERAATMNPFKTMLERGLVLGAGSDAPVTPLDPWGAVVAMTRHHDPAQRLAFEEAIAVHTAGGARLARHDDKKGILTPGTHADLAAYDDDPWEAQDPTSLRPILTVSGGREVFAR